MRDGGAAALGRGIDAYADDRFDDARDAWERAFGAFESCGDRPAAARAASLLGELHWGTFGNTAAGRGWLERARRLLEEAGPCVEWGYWELARMACHRPDVDDLAASAARALEIARAHGDAGLEVRALADAGYARICQGRVGEGFRLLDEALAAISQGGVSDEWAMGSAFCSLLSSCDRSGDLVRAEEWVRLIEAAVIEPGGGRPRILHTHCRVAYGSVLCASGRLAEAEAAINDALGPDASACIGHRIDARARLAELRLRQGRLDEAEQLLSTIEDHVSAAAPLALLHLRRRAPELAAAVLRAGVKRMVGDVLRGAPLVGLLVEAELARGDVAAARSAAELLRSMSAASDSDVVASWLHTAQARIALADGHADDAVRAAEAAVAALADCGAPVLSATAHLLLATALETNGDTPGAVIAARAAHAIGRRTGCDALCDESAAVLRRLGAPPPRPDPAAAGAVVGSLTGREREVLELIRAGRTNAEIAATLFLSAKTVEHHVGRVLAKLGVRSRTEAAALAASAGAAGASPGGAGARA